ncbi:MAG: hypothetical protein ACK479_15305 [Fluviicola sp.]
MSRLIDFNIESEGKFSSLFRELDISTFKEACSFVQSLRYGRISDRSEFSLVLSEKKGTCSSKHALLSELALENGIEDLELICGIYLMNAETNPKISPILEKYNLLQIPECHVYFRYKNERFDFTGIGFDIKKVEPFIVREQRMESNQSIEWKVKIHQNYIESWLRRNQIINFTA